MLSCIGPIKDRPPIPELIDTSPEELRVEAYKARDSKNGAAYVSFNFQIHDLDIFFI